MADATNLEGSEKSRGEDELIIQRNLDLLRTKFVDEIPYWELDDETREALKGIGGGDRSVRGEGEKEEIETYFVLTYNTKTGKIVKPPKSFTLGDFSVLRTNVVNKGKQIERSGQGWIATNKGTNYIELFQKGGMPMPHEYSAAIAGETDKLEGEGRKILPERMIPDEPRNRMGIHESWGKSRFTDAHGDIVILKAIQKFNALFGPPR